MFLVVVVFLILLGKMMHRQCSWLSSSFFWRKWHSVGPWPAVLAVLFTSQQFARHGPPANTVVFLVSRVSEIRKTFIFLWFLWFLCFLWGLGRGFGLSSSHRNNLPAVANLPILWFSWFLWSVKYINTHFPVVSLVSLLSVGSWPAVLALLFTSQHFARRGPPANTLVFLVSLVSEIRK